MVKKGYSKRDVVVAILFFLAFYFSLNILERDVSNQIIGIVFLIAFLYVSINILKGKKVF